MLKSIYYYIDKFNREEIYKLNKSINIIYRNYSNKFNTEELLQLVIFCKKNGKIIGQGYNQKEQLKDPTAHAEIIAITSAASTLNDWRLNGCLMYVTKEPCVMCSGAIINSRISTLIFGAYDDEKGCCGSLYTLCGDSRLESQTTVRGGVEEEQCSILLKDYFKKKREKG